MSIFPALLRCLALAACVLVSLAGPWPVTAEAQTTGGSADVTFASGDEGAKAVVMPAGVKLPQPPTPNVGNDVHEPDSTPTARLIESNPPYPPRNTGASRIVRHPPTVSIGAPARPFAIEGETLSFPVTMDHQDPQDITFIFEFAGTATIDDDYAPTGNGTLTIPTRARRGNLVLETFDDRIGNLGFTEGNESVEVTIVDVQPPGAAVLDTTMATGWIIDIDRAQTATVADVTAREGESLVFEVALSGRAFSWEVTFEYEVTPGTATENADYGGPFSGTLTFVPGEETVKQIELALVDDLVVEGDETLTLEVTGARGTKGERRVATGTIIDNDSNSEVTVADATAPEDENLVFEVTLTPANSQEVTVEYAFVPGTATEDVDYRGMLSGEVTFTPGQTAKEVELALVDDAVAEGDETVMLEVTGVRGATVADGVATGTITDNDGTPAVRVADATAAEDAPLVFAVILSPASAQEVSVQYAITPGTAQAADYAGPTSGAVTFAPGQTAKEVVLDLVDDEIAEGDETVTLALSNVRGATVADGVATGTITDNDDPPVLAVADATGPEGTRLAFAVTLSAPSSRDIEFRYEVTPGTATEHDYTEADGGTLRIPAGGTEGDIRVNAVDDDFYEPDETFEVVISDPLPAGGVTIGRAVATGTITDGDGPPAVTVADATAPENASLVFEVTLSLASSREATVDYEFAPGTAVENADYAGPTSGSVTFAPGETAREVELALVDDAVAEEDETVTLALSNVRGATLADGVATGTIMDNDGTPAMAVADATAGEGDGRLVFPVTLSRASSREVSVQYAVTSETAGAADYAGPTSGSVTFAPGETVKEVALELVDDEIAEEDETVALALSGVRGATLADGVATGTIMDNDGVPAVTVGDATAAEGAGRLAFAVTLSPASSREVSVEYEFAPGTATANADYGGPFSGEVTFAPGETVKEVALDLVDDEVDEEDETVTLALSAPRGATLTGTTATGTILDDDLPRVTVAAEAGVVAEGGDAAFVLTRAGATTEGLTVAFSVTGGDAVLASPPPTEAAFEAGAATARVTLATEDDGTDEADATVTLTLAVGTGYELGSPSRAAVVVRDDDETPEASVGDAAAVPEGGALAFPVSLSHPADAAVTVDYVLGGTATAGEDYEGPAAGSVTFAPGETEKAIVVATVDDERDESDETVEVMLSDGAAYDLGASRAEGVILDDDDPPSVTVSAAAGRIVEGEAARFVLRRTGDASEALTVELVVSERGGGDMVPAGSEGSRRATFAAGATTATLAVPTAGDGVAGPDSEVTAALAGGDGYAVGRPDSATVAVADGGGGSLLAEGRRLGAASLLRRHVQRFSQLTSVAALAVLEGSRPPSTTNLRADGDRVAATGDFGLDLPSGWNGWGSVRYTRLTESADGGVRDFYAGGSRVGADGRSVYGALIGFESAPVTSRGVRLDATHAQLGLYGARRLGKALILDGALGLGRGDHDLSLVGGPYPVAATHRSTRLVARGDLTGDFGWGGAGPRIEPQLGLLYAREDLDAFTDSRGGVAPGERLWLARIGFGPRLTWQRSDGATRASLRMNFDAHNLGPSGEDMEEVSAALELGQRWRLGVRSSLDVSAGVDGLGSDWFSSTSFGLTYEGAF